MSNRLAGRNKAVKHPLITNDPEYQNRVMLYNVLANKIMSDPRSLDPRLRGQISRANNLVNAESTALFDPNLKKVEQLFKENPNLEGVPFDTVKGLVRSPLNRAAAEMDMLRGWHKGEVHHGVPVGGTTAITSELPYENWGDLLYNSAREMPITSQAYNGLIALSSPAHNLAHFDPISRQFFKGEGAHSANIILPGTSNADALYELIDQLTPHHRMSKFAEEIDRPFKQQLALMLNDKGLSVKAKDLTSTQYNPTGRGASIAEHLYHRTSPSMNNAATRSVYGSNDAHEAATNVLGRDQIRTDREAKDARNAAVRAAKLHRQSAANKLPTTIQRPGTNERLNSIGLNQQNINMAQFN